MSFTERETLVIEVLREAGRPIVGAHLADLLGVSPRTLRYDIGRINRLRGIPLIESDAGGYSLNLVAYGQVLGAASPVSSVLEDDERLLVHLLDLTTADIYDVARDCYLSESAVRSATARLASRVSAHGLTVSVSGSRITVDGSELDRRRVLGGLVREAGNASIGAEWKLRRLLPEVDLDEVEAALARGLGDERPHTDDIAWQNLVVNLAICLQRADHPVEAAHVEPAPNGDRTPSEQVVEEIVRAFPTRMISPGDRVYLRRLVWVVLDSGLAADRTGELPDEAGIGAVVTRAVEDCIRHFDLQAQRDRLVASIIEHTRRFFARKATLVYFRNGLRESLRTRSPYLYDVAVYLAHQISSALGVQVSDDEISLFAIYLGLYASQRDDADTIAVTLVCPRYQTLQEWLLARMVEQFGEKIAIVDVVSTIAAAEATDCELVVSTIGSGTGQRPVAEISAICSDLDLEKVRTQLSEIRNAHLRTRTRSALARFLDPRLFFADTPHRDSEEVIDFLCQQLIATGKVPTSYTQSVRVREAYSSTAFAHRFAVPHSMEFIANEAVIAVLIPRAPVRWGDTEVALVLMLALNEDDLVDFTWFYQQLVQLLGDPQLFGELRAKRDFEAFSDYLADHFSRSRKPG
ncbi:MAG: PTS sugar transporter subunit IIA [Propionibacteriaceae bacterium]|nr:PTS sugar transporter subunit IIA [Propionibacteriaceae bacterium]